MIDLKLAHESKHQLFVSILLPFMTLTNYDLFYKNVLHIYYSNLNIKYSIPDITCCFI